MTLEKPKEGPAPGSIFAGRYMIIEELGEGGMGKVFRVEDTKIKEEVALKLIKPEIAADKKTIERFRNELKIARKIRHKNVCGMYDLGEEKAAHYITMEYVPGDNLKDFIKRSKQLPVQAAVSLARQIGAGLAEAHRIGVVHRDMKPQNIMIDQGGNARIMDFGIARMMRASELTEQGAIIGTPYYMSPEQVDGKEADQRADLYSLGVILYEMVTGRLPFQGDGAMSVALKHKTEIPAFPRELNAQVPESLNRLILKCMEKDREQRYQRAEDIVSGLADIEKEIEGETGTTPVRKPDIPLPTEREFKNSIAVLPFKDMSPQKDQDYFCEGLAEELINALTHVQDLKVAARSSSFSFKKQDVDIREIGRILNVGTVLEGSVQKSGNSLRITAQLISVSDGYHLWSERFDRTMDNIFAIQDEISIAIVEKLKGELDEEDKGKITKRHTTNEEALNLFLQGRYFFNRRFQGDMIKAVGFYQRAIDEDPGYVLPYAGIADVFNILGFWAFIHPKDAYTRAQAMLLRANEIDNSISEVYSSLGFLTLGYEWDLPAARDYLLRSIELNPQNALAHAWNAEILAYLGKKEEAVAEAERAIECDPLFSLLHSIRGVVLGIGGQVDEGREQIEKAITMNPDQPMPYLFQGFLYLFKPSFPERAIEYLQKALEFGMIIANGWLAAAYTMNNQMDLAWKTLEELDRIEKDRYFSPFQKARIYLKPEFKHFRFMRRKYVTPLIKFMAYLAMNKQDEALEWLERSVQERDYFYPIMTIFIEGFDLAGIEKLKANPRFKALKRKIKFEQTKIQHN